MVIEKNLTDFLNSLPPWDKALGKYLKPLNNFVDLLLIGSVLFTIAIIVYVKSPTLKMLYFAFLVSP